MDPSSLSLSGDEFYPSRETSNKNKHDIIYSAEAHEQLQRNDGSLNDLPREHCGAGTCISVVPRTLAPDSVVSLPEMRGLPHYGGSAGAQYVAPGNLRPESRQNDADLGGPVVANAIHERMKMPEVERLSKKYLQIKQQNTLLKEALRQQQEQGDRSEEVRRLQEYIKIKEMEQRQHMEELDTLQFANRKKEERVQQLQHQLQQQRLSLLRSNAHGNGSVGSGWGLSLLGGGSGSKEGDERKREEERQILREELEIKIKENEQMHVQNFELRRQHNEEVSRLNEEVVSLKNQRDGLLQQQQDKELEWQRRFDAQVDYSKGSREELRRLENQLCAAKEQNDDAARRAEKELLECKCREGRLRERQQRTWNYLRDIVGVDVSRIRVLSCYNAPAGGAAVFSASHTLVWEHLVSSTAVFLVGIQRLLTAWATVLEDGAGGIEEGSDCCDAAEHVTDGAPYKCIKLKPHPSVIGIYGKIETTNKKARMASLEANRCISMILNSLTLQNDGCLEGDFVQPREAEHSGGPEKRFASIPGFLRGFGSAFRSFMAHVTLAYTLERDSFSRNGQGLRNLKDEAEGHRYDSTNLLITLLQRLKHVVLAMVRMCFVLMGRFARRFTRAEACDEVEAQKRIHDDLAYLARQHFQVLTSALEENPYWDANEDSLHKEVAEAQNPSSLGLHRQQAAVPSEEGDVTNSIDSLPSPYVSIGSVQMSAKLQQRKSRRRRKSEERSDQMDDVPVAQQMCKNVQSCTALTCIGAAFGHHRFPVRSKLLRLLRSHLTNTSEFFEQMARCLSCRARTFSVDACILPLSGGGQHMVNVLQALRSLSGKSGSTSTLSDALGLYMALSDSTVTELFKFSPFETILSANTNFILSLNGILMSNPKPISRDEALVRTSLLQDSLRRVKQQKEELHLIRKEFRALSFQKSVIENRLSKVVDGCTALQCSDRIVLREAGDVFSWSVNDSTSNHCKAEFPAVSSEGVEPVGANVDSAVAAASRLLLTTNTTQESTVQNPAARIIQRSQKGRDTPTSLMISCNDGKECTLGDILKFVAYQRSLINSSGAGEVRELLREIANDENIISILKMQISSCLKSVNALEEQRIELARKCKSETDVASEAIANADAKVISMAETVRRSEWNYGEQLKLLSIHVADVEEKANILQLKLDEIKAHKILCGRCGVWNTIDYLIKQGDDGTCIMCRGRVTQRPS